MAAQELPVIAKARFSGAVLLPKAATVNAPDGTTQALQADTNGRIWSADNSGAMARVGVGNPDGSTLGGLNDATPYGFMLGCARIADVATTGNISNLLTGAPNFVDSSSLTVGSRVLVWKQTTSSQNGLYSVTTVGTGANGVWARVTDSDQFFDFTFQTVVVGGGLTQAGSIFRCTTAPTTVGTDPVAYTKISFGDRDARTRTLYTNVGGAIAPDSGTYALQIYTDIDASFGVIDSDGENLPVVGQRQGFSPAVLAKGGTTFGWIEVDRGATATVAGTQLARFGAGGLDSGGVLRTAKGVVDFEGDGVWSSNSDTPTRMFVRLCTDGSGTLADTLELHADGRILMNNRKIAPRNAGSMYSTSYVETLPRWMCSPMAALTSGTLYLMSQDFEVGDVVATIFSKAGGTGSSTTTHWYFALYDKNLALLGQSADQTTTQISANSIFQASLTSAYTIPTADMYYIGFMAIASSMPTIQGYTSGNANGANNTPRLNATSTTGLLTGVAPNPAGAVTGVAPRYWFATSAT